MEEWQYEEWKYEGMNSMWDGNLTGCCSRIGVNDSLFFVFLEWWEVSLRSFVGRESAAIRRQNREGGTFTFSLQGRGEGGSERRGVSE